MSWGREGRGLLGVVGGWLGGGGFGGVDVGSGGVEALVGGLGAGWARGGRGWELSGGR